MNSTESISIPLFEDIPNNSNTDVGNSLYLGLNQSQGLIIAFVLFCIAIAIMLWMMRDCRDVIEEGRDLVRRTKDEEEANRNKCDAFKRKRAIDATIVKQKLNIHKKLMHDNYHSNAASTSSKSSNHSVCNDENSNESHIHIQEKNKSNKYYSNDANDDDIEANEEERNTCSVCLEPFLNNEELSWSKSFKCKHIFHTQCLIPWLMKHEECPCCRTMLMTTHDFLDKTYDNLKNDNNRNGDKT